MKPSRVALLSLVASLSLFVAREAAPDEPTARARIVARARMEVARKVVYDPSWVALAYPNGDPPADKGVCTDVVVRAYRSIGVDFQQRIHDDILRRKSAYKTVEHADRSIDHRRVPPMLAYLRAHATSLTKSFEDPSAFLPGDIVVIAFHACPGCVPEHVGIVSDRLGPRGLPLLIHNMGPTAAEDDVLDAWTLVAHFRLPEVVDGSI